MNGARIINLGLALSLWAGLVLWGCGGEIVLDNDGSNLADGAFDAGLDGHDGGLPDGDVSDGDTTDGSDQDPDGGDETCVPSSCVAQGLECGLADDGCGNEINCGGCPDGAPCVDGYCQCTPDSCQSLGHECGTWANGCGDQIFCGDCPANHDCNNGQCQCLAATCSSLGLNCDTAADGCGGQLNCGSCPSGQSCDQGQCVGGAVDCSGIAANSNFELCESSATHCAGVFTNGAGCISYCAAAGLACTARFGGEPNCIQESTSIPCSEVNDHLSDWCVCGEGQVDPNCEVNPSDPPTQHEKHYSNASFNPRSSWVLQCRDYAYTAQYEEHEACDSQYSAGSGRGTATFTFSVPRGNYDVFIEGRHTENRNPSGALVSVTSNGQTHSVTINQRDDAGLVWDLHGRYCLNGSVVVVMDSTVSGASDSIRSVRLTPAGN